MSRFFDDSPYTKTIVSVDVSLIQVTQPIGITPLPEEIARRPSFGEIWEQDAMWLMGRGLLSDCVAFLRDRGGSLIAQSVPGRPPTVEVELPLPLVRDEVTSRLTAVQFAVPRELRSLFNERVDLVISTRPWAAKVLEQVDGQRADKHTLDQMNHEIRRCEQQCLYNLGLPLWFTAAMAFGLDPYNLPEPAGIAIHAP